METAIWVTYSICVSIYEVVVAYFVFRPKPGAKHVHDWEPWSDVKSETWARHEPYSGRKVPNSDFQKHYQERYCRICHEEEKKYQ